MSYDDIMEAKINSKNSNTPRITPKIIDDVIYSKVFYVFPRAEFTVCLLTLENGFNVIGESACANPKNFNKEIGEDIAYKKAVEKIWQLEEYLLKQKLYNKNL